MKALSLWQPWASLVVRGLKLIETRGWQTHVRGRFLVHAAGMKNYQPILKDLIRLSGISAKEWGLEGDLPLGAIVGAATLEDCVPTNAANPRLIAMPYREAVFGNFSEGRWAWLLKDTEEFATPIHVRGRQGWFNVGGVEAS